MQRLIAWIEKQKTTQLIVILIVFYFITRIIGAVFFVVHNDEVIYTQYAQLIHMDRGQYFSISYNGTMHGDIKDPLQFRISSLFITIFKNPFLSMRFVAIIAGAIGFVFFLLLCKALTNQRIYLVLGGWIYLLSPYYSYFDAIAITEVFVYSSGVAYLYSNYMIGSLLGTQKQKTRILPYILSGIFFLGLCVFFKLSGILFIPLGLGFLGLGYVNNLHGAKIKIKTIGLLLGIFLISAIVPILTHEFLINVDTSTGTGANIIYPISERLSFAPTRWAKSLYSYVVTIAGGNYYGIIHILTLCLLGFHIFQACRNKEYQKLIIYLILACMIAFSILYGPILLKKDGGYVRHKGMFLFVTFLTLMYTLSRIAYRTRLHRVLILSLLGIGILGGLQTSGRGTLRKDGINPLVHAETPETRAMGFQYHQLVDTISHLPKGMLRLDSWRGHPGTTFQVLSTYYPHIKIEYIPSQFLNNPEQYIEKMGAVHDNVYLLFDSGRPEREQMNRLLLSSPLCKNYQKLNKTYNGKILKGTEITLCFLLK